MSIESVDTLYKVLRRVQLLTPAQVDEVVRELGPYFKDPRSLAQYLVEIDWLTAYQYQLLFEGQWDELMIGRYQVLDRLGKGGVSEVFKAWDTVRGRVVALKVLHHHLAGQSDAVRQFQRELQTVTRLSHPNIIKTYDAHKLGDLHYFAMECVEGMDLDKYVQQVGPLPVEQACDFARQVALGLQHAHQLGLVHRDIKPANLYLINQPLPSPPGSPPPPRRGIDPHVKILDWGLARVQPDFAQPAGEGHADPDAEKGFLIGTADYIAPEQARDASLVDIRADIYSLGCSLYFLLTGRPPFPGSSLMQKILQHQGANPPSLREARPEVSEELDSIVLKMMAKQAEERYQIPLLVAGALLRFTPASSGNSGTFLRPVLPGAGRPASSPCINVNRPGSSPGVPTGRGSSANVAEVRPGSSPNFTAPPGANGSAC